jgi:hypothetical protein
MLPRLVLGQSCPLELKVNCRGWTVVLNSTRPYSLKQFSSLYFYLHNLNPCEATVL